MPSKADFEFMKMQRNRRRTRRRSATPEQRAIHAQQRMAEVYLAKLHPGKLPKRDHNGYMRVSSFLADLAWRVMNDRHLAGLEQPQHAELQQALRSYITRHLGKFVNDHGDPTMARPAFHQFRFIDTEQADYLARSLATSLLRDWGPEWIEEQVRRGRVGGSKPGKEGPTWDADDLAVLDLYTDRSNVAAFAAYNVTRAKPRSRATLYRMLGDLRERQQEHVAPPLHEAAVGPQETAPPTWQWGSWERPLDRLPAQRDYRRKVRYPGER